MGVGGGISCSSCRRDRSPRSFHYPKECLPEPLKVWLSFAAVQGVLDPLTPAGQDGITRFSAAGGRMLGYPMTPATQRAFVRTAERFWINLTPFFRNAATRPLVRGLPGVIDPGSEAAFRTLLQEPALGPFAQRISARTLRHLLPVLVPLAGRFLFSLLRPDTMRARAFRRADELEAKFRAELVAAEQRAQPSSGPRRRGRQTGVAGPIRRARRRERSGRLRAARGRRRCRERRRAWIVIERMLAAVPPALLSHVIPAFAPSMAMLNLLFRAGARRRWWAGTGAGDHSAGCRIMSRPRWTWLCGKWRSRSGPTQRAGMLRRYGKRGGGGRSDAC